MISPKLSFIVLSYNYENYIRQTIESILAQTVSDFEIIVVDDCSTDGSRDVVRSFADPRLRLIENERNLGGAGSYNVAVKNARGEWLVNLDADDWIAPEKCARQLVGVEAHPAIDIIGSWVHVVDGAGERHPQAEDIEMAVNRHHRLNLTETWVGQNLLCRSSTMVRRATHMQFGLDDVGMTRAPDYELWTRALARGARFALLPEKLTYMRQHARGVTHGDPVTTLLEMSYAMLRNLAPLAERRAIFDCQSEIVNWIARNDSLISLTPRQALKLLGLSVSLRPFETYVAFKEFVSDPSPVPELERIGRHGFFAAMNYTPPGTMEKLNSDILAYTEARDYWKSLYDRTVAKMEADAIENVNTREYCKAECHAVWAAALSNAASADALLPLPQSRLPARGLDRFVPSSLRPLAREITSRLRRWR